MEAYTLPVERDSEKIKKQKLNHRVLKKASTSGGI